MMTQTDTQPSVIEVDFNGSQILELEIERPLLSCHVFNEQSECIFPIGFTIDRHINKPSIFKLALELGWGEITKTGIRQNWHPPGRYKVVIN